MTIAERAECQKAFEFDLIDNWMYTPGDFQQDAGGRYLDDELDFAWECAWASWQAARRAPAAQDVRGAVLAALLAHKMATHCDADGDAAALVDFLGLDGVRPGIAREEIERIAETVCVALAAQQAGKPLRSMPTLLKAETAALWHAVNWMKTVLVEWHRGGFKDDQDRAQHDDQRQRLKLAKQALRKVNRLRKEGL